MADRVRRARGLHRFELGVLVVFAALSMWVVASNLVVGASEVRRWTYTDGYFSTDQMQYLAWIESSARHGLISNLFVLRHTPADYVQPAIMLSGLLVRAGMAPWLALLLWKPVAVLSMFLAVRALARRCLRRTIDIRAALVLGLLFGSLTDVYGSLGIVGDMIPMWQSWGYPFGLIAVALVVYALLAYARARDAGHAAWAPGLLGGVAATLHPWQGELMALVLVGAELVRARETLARLRDRGGGPRAIARDPGLRLLAITLVLVVVPLVYYIGLGHFDSVWSMAQDAGAHSFSETAVLIGIAPLLAFALLGYRGRPGSFLELLLRAWPPAALLIWILSASALAAAPLHAVNGITVPLSVLAVLGVRRSPLARLGTARIRGGLAAAAVVIGTVPAIAFTMQQSHEATNPAVRNPNWLAPGDDEALHWLRHDPRPGGILTRRYLGKAVPGLTGRATFVGDCLWSEPGCDARERMVLALLNGRLSAADARRFVSATGARFLLAGCGTRFDPRRQLGGLVLATRRFGCATVYELADSGPARGPLAARRRPATAA